MTKKKFDLWLTTQQVGLDALTKDLDNHAQFDSEELIDAFSEATRYDTTGKDQLTVDKDVATWGYNTDNEEMFDYILCYYLDDYQTYIIPIYSVSLSIYGGGTQTMSLSLSRTKNKVASIVRADFELRTGDNYKIDFYKIPRFDIQKEVSKFIDFAEDGFAYDGDFDLEEEEDEEGNTRKSKGGILTYTSYLAVIKARKKQKVNC